MTSPESQRSLLVSRQLSRRLLVALIVPLLLAGALVPMAPTPTVAVGGSTFTSVVNRYRSEVGVSPVALHDAVDQVAVERAGQLAAARRLGHDLQYVADRLAQLGACWESVGEIVAWSTSSDYEGFVRQWYNSDPHRAIMLQPAYTHVGGSWSVGSDGHYYAVMIFVRLCRGASSGGGFTDIATSPFLSDIQWLVAAGITKGCSATQFCPTATVTRDQMASFIARALDLPAAASDYFVDDAGSTHEPDINRIGEAAITNGCASRLYCPTWRVARDQMASFLVRALGLPPAGRDYFWDDSGSMHEDAINRLAAAGVTKGCGGGMYCPSGSVTREQMAAFLHRAFD